MIATDSLLKETRSLLPKLDAVGGAKAENIKNTLLDKTEDVRDQYRSVEKMSTTKKAADGSSYTVEAVDQALAKLAKTVDALLDQNEIAKVTIKRK
eukprot:3313794-Pyramimonas_sp.AAC.1